MRRGKKINRRPEVPSFREFLNQEKILRESGIIDSHDSDKHPIKPKISHFSAISIKSKEKHNSDKTFKSDYNENQIKAINIEKFKLIKENGLLKEEIENYRKSLEKKDFRKKSSSKDEKIKKLEREIMRLKNSDIAKKEKEKEKENDIPNGIVNEDLEENKMNKIIEEQKLKLRELNEQKNKTEQKLLEYKSKNEEINTEKNELNKTIDELKSKLDKTNKEKNKLNKDITELKSKIKT